MRHLGAIALFEITLAVILVIIGLLPTGPGFWVAMGCSALVVAAPIAWSRR